MEGYRKRQAGRVREERTEHTGRQSVVKTRRSNKKTLWLDVRKHNKKTHHLFVSSLSRRQKQRRATAACRRAGGRAAHPHYHNVLGARDAAHAPWQVRKSPVGVSFASLP